MGKDEKKEKNKKEKKEKKEKKPKEVKKLIVKSAKARPKDSIVPHTGTRFKPDTARQLAFDIVYKGAKAGKKVKEIRKELADTRKDNGNSWNLDAAYINFVAAYHPDFFELFSDGTVKILKEPKPDKEAAAKLDAEREVKKKKAAEARKKREEAAKGNKGKKGKKEKPEDDDDEDDEDDDDEDDDD